ncbi:hypothetical protein BDM02DRAFT_2211671 [Thelephora ganbajun]|uniref:Uncharacterized protein n=1 Tax=Thelephora ganbajun TaxID=370292 RepID=A0ACB6ZGX4_THEGA|nr:hypothetical protein BDM02DRAFT_2211671 [Thelephora ganbajun]
MNVTRGNHQDLGGTISDGIRVGSIAIAAYDYLLTLPAEWRFWKSQCRRNQKSASFCLFILLRYASIATIIISGYTYFDGGFSPAECERWYLASPSMKGVQLLISQAIMAWRCRNISRRHRGISWFLGVLFVSTCIGQSVTDLYGRVPSQSNGNCRAVDQHRVAWIYYIFAVVFDITTTGIAMFYMIRLDAKSNLMVRLKRLLITHGLAYFISLTVVNALNLSLYVSYEGVTQSAAVPLGHAFVWILSQRILIDLHDLSLKRSPLAITEEPETVVIYITGSATGDQNGNGRAIERQRGGSKPTIDPDIQVRIQRRSRQSRHTTRDGSHDSLSPTSPMA